ncbi:MAG TPA: GNAT family N-acetyltransferase [Acidimicrobiales bacterium]|nr:GNAT family N-acetyltransferase [Acidimicrobiales bacterium]
MTRSPVEKHTVNTRSGDVVVIGPLADTEHDVLFALFADIVAGGEGYPQAPPLSRGMFETTWVTSVTLAVAARVEDTVVGAYYLKPNFPGRAAHIANAGYVVDAGHRRSGIGRLLVEDSVWRAPLLGFDAIQFNLVFAGNPARALYEELGWREIGRLPDVVDGEDALIYWRRVG